MRASRPIALLVFTAALSASPVSALPIKPQSGEKSGTVRLTLDALEDKIRGGWAGQTVGCTFGRRTEFRFPAAFIQDYQPLPWDENAVADCFREEPGLYDDVYMDLTFVDVMAREGIDAPAVSLAKAFAEASYPLWHANQMARYNILRGLLPPNSGSWRNNPHADDIDFQIEADFAGLMSPGMPRTAAAIADRVGHIMSSGDGWYGGVYVAVMYALAFVRDDIGRVVEEALAVLPPESGFARIIADVIRWHREEPGDWKSTWFKVQRTWGEDIGCPEGVFAAFNIDARINCAWAVLGLLYGGGDFGRTLEISQRCGDDSDCNPATAGGILGTLLGFKKIPAVWTNGLRKIEGRPFPYTTISLDDAVRLSRDQAVENIKKNGGAAAADGVTIAVQPVVSVPLEVNFAGHRPVARVPLDLDLGSEGSFRFKGIGFAVNGEAVAAAGIKHVFRAELLVDGRSAGILDLPTERRLRNPTPFWAYGLAPGEHEVLVRVLNPAEGARLRLSDAVIYAERKDEAGHKTIRAAIRSGPDGRRELGPILADKRFKRRE
jgi:hypothetical protein